MKAPTFLPDCLPRIFLAECGPKGGQGGERKAPCFSAGIFIPRWVFRQLRPEGDWGERREARAQWAQPPKAVSDPEFRQTTSGAHGSANRADCLPRGKPPVRPQAHTPALPPVGPDAPTPARGHGLQPYGALTLFFRWRKKSVQKKASGTATPGKSPLLPILAAGLAMSRAAELASYACYRARSELAFFRRQNGRAFFPPLPIAALLPRSRRWAGLSLAGWDVSV